MKTINDLLKQAYQYADNTAVKLHLHVPLRKIRANSKLLSSLGVSQVTVLGAKKPAAKKAKPKAKAKKAVKKAVKRKKPAVKSRPKVAVKKKAAAKKKAVKRKVAAKKKPAKAKAKPKAKAKAKKAPAKKGKTKMVTQEGVLAAIRAKNSTPQAIAKAMKANPVQVGKALSRYTQKKIIRRTKPGHYALK